MSLLTHNKFFRSSFAFIMVEEMEYDLISFSVIDQMDSLLHWYNWNRNDYMSKWLKNIKTIFVDTYVKCTISDRVFCFCVNLWKQKILHCLLPSEAFMHSNESMRNNKTEMVIKIIDRMNPTKFYDQHYQEK